MFPVCVIRSASVVGTFLLRFFAGISSFLSVPSCGNHNSVTQYEYPVGRDADANLPV